MKRLVNLSGLACGLISSISFAAQTLKPHVHGNARVTIALDSPTKGNIDLDAPGDSIIGFEHPAKTTKDKKTVEAAFHSLRTQGVTLVQFDPSLGCEVTAKEVGFEKESAESAEVSEKETGHHQDVNASYQVTCKKSLIGSSAQIGLMGLFPRVKKVTVQILTEKNQSEKTFSTDHGNIQF